MHYSCMCGMHSAVVNLSNITDTVLLNKVTHYLAMSTGRSVYPLSSHSALLLSPPFLVSPSVPLSASLPLFLSLSFSPSLSLCLSSRSSLSALFLFLLFLLRFLSSLSLDLYPSPPPFRPRNSVSLSGFLFLPAFLRFPSFLSFFVSSLHLLLSLLMYTHT